jgi:predicted nuclease of predicted toxin-antitoxin system
VSFLLDANLSPETREYLVATFGFDVIDLQTAGLGGLSDAEVIALAKGQGRIIITFDLDFGEIYHASERGTVGVIILRLADQTIESVNGALTSFFRATAGYDLERSLIVIEERRFRILPPPS